MVLLHGGAYQLGAGSQPKYNGKGLAARGAVVVTMNYRLGPLGFLAHPELTAEAGSSDNYVLHDVIAAPIVDGAVLPGQLDLQLKSGTVNAVPLLAGWNADEGTPYPPFATTLAAYDSTAATRFASFASDFKAVYPATTDAEVQAMAYQPMRDGTFARGGDPNGTGLPF